MKRFGSGGSAFSVNGTVTLRFRCSALVHVTLIVPCVLTGGAVVDIWARPKLKVVGVTWHCAGNVAHAPPPPGPPGPPILPGPPPIRWSSAADCAQQGASAQNAVNRKRVMGTLIGT